MEHTSHSSSRESRTDSNAARVQGGRPLNGVVPVGGSRNAALSIMAASLLADGPVNLQGVPRVSDVAVLCGMLVQLGVDVRRLTGDRLRLETVDREPTVVPEKLIQRSRAGFLALGPLLARRGRATVALPGICALGDRPVDVPLRGLAALGADVRVQGGCVVAKARHLRGASIDLRGERGTTVSGTANVLCAATLAQGETVLTGAAAEPEIVDLCRFLQAMGARVEGVGTSTLRVRGVSQLNGPTYGVIPDRLEAATLLIAAAAVGGRVTATGLIPKHLDAVLDWLRQAGCELWVGGDWVTVERRGPLTPCNVSAAAYPGIPSDLQPALTVLLALAHGKSRVSDSVFPW
ncbi:MAG: UDP-N-acetylglucosamine 1-carboxyvinyltransferase, partial [Planctomycetales bacterium]